MFDIDAISLCAFILKILCGKYLLYAYENVSRLLGMLQHERLQ